MIPASFRSRRAGAHRLCSWPPRTIVRAEVPAVPTLAEKAFPNTEPIATGKFQPTWDSLNQYEFPDWFRDAKFGIWAHWGPQCQPEAGDWYARNMYQQYNKQGQTQPRITSTILLTTGIRLGLRLQRHPAALEGGELGPGETGGLLQAMRREILHGAGEPPRQLRHLGQQVPTLERHEDRPAQGPDRRLGQGRARRRAAVRRERPRRTRVELERVYPPAPTRTDPWPGCPTTAT